jgi:hypothetical protein
MTLREKQAMFVLKVSWLINFAIGEGYEVTFGEAYRSPEEAARLAKLGKGIKNSLHTKRLAIDLNLFKDGKYLTATKNYEPLGLWWEARSNKVLQFNWGGRFGDGNHFSISHGGVTK